MRRVNGIFLKTVFALLLLLFAFTSCKKDPLIVIYTVADENQYAFYLKGLEEKFPQYDIVMEFMPSGTGAAKLKAEGTATDGDILCTWEQGYLGMLSDNLATLDWVDNSIYMDDIIDENKKYVPELRNSGAVVLNNELFREKNLPIPESYEDLLDPVYKNLISMPNPKSSGSGYMFLKNLINAWGEEEAFEYFDALTENILQYTTSGVGALNSLQQGEVAVGLGITAQAVTMINQGADITILFFEEGAPYSIYCHAIVKGKENEPGVKEVFEYLRTELTPACDALYYPEQVFKDKVFKVDNYPHPIPYGDMRNNTPDEKVRILEKWKY